MSHQLDREAPAQAFRPTLLAFSISKIYKTPTPPLLLTFVRKTKSGGKVIHHDQVKL